MAVSHLVVLSSSFSERGRDPGRLWLGAGISCSWFQWEGKWAPLVPPGVWLPRFGETAVGPGPAEKRKSVVCAQDRLAPGRVSGHYGVQSWSQKRGAWDPGRLCSSADAVPTLWGSHPHPQSLTHTASKSRQGDGPPKAPPSHIIYPPPPRLHFSA